MKKFGKIVGLVAVLTLALLAFTGCGGSQDALHIYNWGQYMDPAVLEAFTAETGIEVLYEEFPTNEEMYVKVKAGSADYDLLFPSDYMIERLIAEDMLLPLDWDNIPNAKNIDPELMGWDYDPDSTYSIPFFWGTVGMVYNKTMVDDPVESWDILWNDKYAKEIIMLDSSRDSLGIALQRLNYSMNSRSEEELAAAKQSLIDQKPLVLAYVVDEVRDMMLSGEGAIAVVYSGEGVWIDRDSEDLVFVNPKDGTNLWIDGACIPKTAKHKEEAEQFIDYICRPEVAAQISDYVGYSTPNLPARELLDSELTGNPEAYPDADYLSKCEVFRNPGDFVETYNQTWTEILSQ